MGHLFTFYTPILANISTCVLASLMLEVCENPDGCKLLIIGYHELYELRCALPMSLYLHYPLTLDQTGWHMSSLLPPTLSCSLVHNIYQIQWRGSCQVYGLVYHQQSKSSHSCQMNQSISYEHRDIVKLHVH